MWRTDLPFYNTALEKMRALETEIYAKSEYSQFTIDAVDNSIADIESAIETLRTHVAIHNYILDFLNTYHISRVLDIINPALTKDIDVLNRIQAIFKELEEPTPAK